MDLKEKVKKFPNKPGVYRWLDRNKRVLYVGRATSLRNRVSQYFGRNISPRIAEMVSQARDIKFTECETVLDTVILEANLIKKHNAKYNAEGKDGRSFIYVVIAKEEYPRPILVRARELSKFPTKNHKVFGPYKSRTIISNVLKILRRVFPYSKCKANSGKVCFEYQIGVCPGICIGEADRTEYQRNIKNIALVLGGHKKRLLKKLAKDNPEQAYSFKHIQDVILLSSDDMDMSGVHRIEGYDISHLSGKEIYGSMVVFTNGVADKSQYRLFKIRSSPSHDDLRALREVMTRRLKHDEWRQADIIMIDGGKPQIDFVTKLFNELNVKIPLVGISKYAGDKLVFPKNTKKSIKDLAGNSKSILLQVREEAHRFSRQASRRNRRKNNY